MMTEGSNYAFCHSLISNSISKTELQKNVLQFNLDLNLKSELFGGIFKKVSENIIKIKDWSIFKWFNIAKNYFCHYIGVDGTYSHNNWNAMMVVCTGICIVQDLYKIIAFNCLKRPQECEN
jgi:hypothetical protein